MMKAAEARKLIRKLKEADVVLVSERGLKHSINRLLQRSKWHHVMLYVGKGYTIEVNPRNGAHTCDLFHDLTEKPYIALKVLRNRKLTAKQRKKITETALRMFSGKRFSWMQFAKIIIGRTLELWREEGSKSMVCKPGHKCSTGSVACSNMVAMAYYEAGFPISEKYMPEYVVPKDYEEAKGFKVVAEKKLL
ncbi:hypothetical protein HYU20_01830 [Candidatus Woesearchaeota archaeon]|nr:hypothetical protein [Candidatus Woesearchaeota archaeon]